ncbi:hypothetical protein [Sphingobacterium sp.]|uniref:hypothetical protein n=1 Tax=Sphingobacterium sp. TaxID=341027 RepID=UPI0031D6B409
MEDKSFKSIREIKIIHPSIFAKSYANYLDGKTAFAEISNKDFLITNFDTEPPEGFQLPEGFPNCCKWHKQIYEQALGNFNEFPGCCEQHKPIAQQYWFDKSDYMYVPLKVVTAIAYTLSCVNQSIKNVNWFKEITDYIKYTIDSFGQFPHGFGSPIGVGQYISCVEFNIADSKEISPQKKEMLHAYFLRLTNVPKKGKRPDLEELIKIYREWISLFPFEISYLSHLKRKLENLLPVLRGPIETNMYTGISSSKLATKKDIINFITDLTNYVINELNAVEAFKKGLIKNNSQTQIEILNARHKVKLKEVTLSGSQSEKTYIKLLKKWLKSEKRYLSELSVILKTGNSNETFVFNIIDGIKLLQAGDTNEDCITTIRNRGSNKEAKVRHWFKNFLAARYQGSVVTSEEENGPGRMDLKIYHEAFGTKVMEFKGWWNSDKKGSVEQIINYLTDFEGEGFIFMINDLEKKDISQSYRKLIEDPKTGFQTDSWQDHPIENSTISYFVSKHKLGIKEKIIYHFIFNVNF